MSTTYNPDALTPAIPPEGYAGTQADWMVGLQQRGLWDGQGWYGDVEIRAEDWWSLLEECEGDEHYTLDEDGKKRKETNE